MAASLAQAEEEQWAPKGQREGAGGGRVGMSHLQQTRNTREHLESSLAGAGQAGQAELHSLKLLGQFDKVLSATPHWSRVGKKQNSSNIHSPGSQGGDSSTMA